MTEMLKTILLVLLLNNDGTIESHAYEFAECPPKTQTMGLFEQQKLKGDIADYWMMCGQWVFKPLTRGT